jgi:hypothetical protein
VRSDADRPVTFSALGRLGATKPADAVAIAGISITGAVFNAEILAGYSVGRTALNPDASIGKVFVGAAWERSSIAAGVADTSIAGNLTSAPDGFGRHDTLIGGVDSTPGILATIASITIKGTATGRATPTADFFGLTAQKIGKVSIHGAAAIRTDPDTTLASDFHLVTV